VSVDLPRLRGPIDALLDAGNGLLRLAPIHDDVRQLPEWP